MQQQNSQDTAFSRLQASPVPPSQEICPCFSFFALGEPGSSRKPSPALKSPIILPYAAKAAIRQKGGNVVR